MMLPQDEALKLEAWLRRRLTDKYSIGATLATEGRQRYLLGGPWEISESSSLHGPQLYDAGTYNKLSSPCDNRTEG